MKNFKRRRMAVLNGIGNFNNESTNNKKAPDWGFFIYKIKSQGFLVFSLLKALALPI